MSEKPMNRPSYRLRRVSDGLTYSPLNLSVYLTGPDHDQFGFSSWLGRAGCNIAPTPELSDMVIFTGGSDVTPALYGERQIEGVHTDAQRDEDESLLFDYCTEEGIPMLGICRGAQFLWVKLGGRLYQDVNNHNEGEHEIIHLQTKKKYIASSVHHQMCVPHSFTGFKLIANACVSTKRQSATFTAEGLSTDFEIYAHTERAILGIQGHPEYPGYPNFSKLCVDLIIEHIYNNKNTTISDGKLRLIKEIK